MNEEVDLGSDLGRELAQRAGVLFAYWRTTG